MRARLLIAMHELTRLAAIVRAAWQVARRREPDDLDAPAADGWESDTHRYVLIQPTPLMTIANALALGYQPVWWCRAADGSVVVIARVVEQQ